MTRLRSTSPVRPPSTTRPKTQLIPSSTCWTSTQVRVARRRSGGFLGDCRSRFAAWQFAPDLLAGYRNWLRRWPRGPRRPDWPASVPQSCVEVRSSSLRASTAEQPFEALDLNMRALTLALQRVPLPRRSAANPCARRARSMACSTRIAPVGVQLSGTRHSLAVAGDPCTCPTTWIWPTSPRSATPVVRRSAFW
jgi:hypothetical protein